MAKMNDCHNLVEVWLSKCLMQRDDVLHTFLENWSPGHIYFALSNIRSDREVWEFGVETTKEVKTASFSFYNVIFAINACPQQTQKTREAQTD